MENGEWRMENGETEHGERKKRARGKDSGN